MSAASIARPEGATWFISGHTTTIWIEQAAQTVFELTPIVLSHRLVADKRSCLAKPRLNRCAPFGRVESPGLYFTRPQHLSQRAGRLQHLGDDGSASATHPVIWILT